MPSVAASAAISAVLRAKLKAASVMSRSKCLAILCLLITAPTASAISAVPRSGSRLRATAPGCVRDRARWRRAGLPLAGALGGKIGVAADDQTLAGEVGCGDAGHVALVEQRELQGAALQQRLDRRRAQRGDPVEAGGLDVFGDARLGDHAAVADQDHMVEVEALLELLDLGRQRHRIGGVAVKHLDGNRAAVGGRRAGRR